MRTLGLIALLLLTAGKSAPAKRGCPFVGVADIAREGEVQNVVGGDLPRAGGSVLAFDGEGQVARLTMRGSGELRLAGEVPQKVKSNAFVHVLLVDAAVKKLRVLTPGKDLPEGIFPDAVEILLGDDSGPKVALVSLPGEGADDACSEIQCKSRGAWKACWTNCR
jgi:hypothetical protein